MVRKNPSHPWRRRQEISGDVAELRVIDAWFGIPSGYQWKFQDPKMEVLYHMFGHILGVYSLT